MNFIMSARGHVGLVLLTLHLGKGVSWLLGQVGHITYGQCHLASPHVGPGCAVPPPPTPPQTLAD